MSGLPKEDHLRQKSNTSLHSNSSSNAADMVLSEDEKMGSYSATLSDQSMKQSDTDDSATHSSSLNSGVESGSDRQIKVKVFGKRDKLLSELHHIEELGGPISIQHPHQLPFDYRHMKENANAFECGFLSDFQEYANLAEVQGPILSIAFSDDGKYLAAGSQDGVLRVWCLNCFYQDESNNDIRSARNKKGIFHPIPYRIYVGHKGAILEVAWSKHNFLCSAGMDKSVRVWHISEISCLCCLQHNEVVTGARFHPLDDRFILTGSLDGRVRIWSLAEKKVKYWNQVLNTNYITAVAFTCDGSMIIAGTFTGECIFFEFEELKYFTQIEAKSSRSSQKGKKITGIECITNSPATGGLEEKILISTNDSRVRVFNLRDKSLLRKYKGHESKNTQIKASFSDDGRYIISGSEDKGIYVWHTDPSAIIPHLSAGILASKSSIGNLPVYEKFGSIDDASVIPCAIFAPTKARLYIDQERGLGRRPTPHTHLEDALIITADCMGRIHVYENQSHHVLPMKVAPVNAHLYQPLQAFANSMKRSPSSHITLMRPKNVLLRTSSNAATAEHGGKEIPPSSATYSPLIAPVNIPLHPKQGSFSQGASVNYDTHFMPRTIRSSHSTGRQRVASAPGSDLKRSNSSVSTPSRTPMTASSPHDDIADDVSANEKREHQHRKYHSYSHAVDDNQLACEQCGGKYFEFLKDKIKCTQCAHFLSFD